MNDDVNMVKYLKNSKFDFEEFFVADFGFAALINNRAHLQHIIVSHETKGNPRQPVETEDEFTSIIKMKSRSARALQNTLHTSRRFQERPPARWHR